MVVKEASAMQGMHNPIKVAEDHISISKPSSKEAPTYRHLKRYIEVALENAQVSCPVWVRNADGSVCRRCMSAAMLCWRTSHAVNACAWDMRIGWVGDGGHVNAKRTATYLQTGCMRWLAA